MPTTAPKKIDLRSDTVTLPCHGMRQAMMRAEVGDDVYDEDPTVKKLEGRLAELAGMEAGLFFPSGTQSNLAALLSHCQRGDEYIVGQNAHTYRYEAGGAAVLGSIQPQPIDMDADGRIDPDKIRAAIKADDFHFARTRLLALENTHGGSIVPLSYLDRAAALARQHGLAFHLDGARVFNAAVGLGIEVGEITGKFDSVSICLSKGLGAPTGSVLCAGKPLIGAAKRWRKMLGGGMRQVGILAAAGLYALEHNVARLQQDHDLAGTLAAQLQSLDGVELVGGGARTNMLFIRLDNGDYAGLHAYAKARGLLIGAQGPLRLVTHKQLDPADITRAAETIAAYVT